MFFTKKKMEFHENKQICLHVQMSSHNANETLDLC